MGLVEITIIGIGLAMDAVAVSMSNSMAYRKLTTVNYISMALTFGLFQGIMPLAGFYAGTIFAAIITRYSGIVIFLILGVIGLSMIMESYRKDEADQNSKKFTFTMLLLQAIATSIDAFAVGVGFCAVQVDIIPAVCIIAAITTVLVLLAIFAGRKFGDIFGSKAELLGGIILIIIGIKGLI